MGWANVVGRWGWGDGGADGGGQMVVGRWWWADGGKNEVNGIGRGSNAA